MSIKQTWDKIHETNIEVKQATKNVIANLDKIMCGEAKLKEEND